MTVALLLTDCGSRTDAFGEAWEAYAARFISAGRVIDRDNEGITHSESQGYGMLFAVEAGDRRGFGELWQWTDSVLRRDDGLFSWRFRPCPAMDRSCVDDPNNASDGDILIAWALFRASRVWRHAPWEAAAREIITAVRDSLVHQDHGYLFLLPGIEGFVRQSNGGRNYLLNLSYYIFPAFHDFHSLTGDPAWLRLADDGMRLLETARFGEARLHPDWMELGPAGVAASEDTRYGYNACRIPLHLAWAPEPKPGLLEPYRAFWAGGVPPATLDLQTGERADYAWSVGMATIAETVNAIAGDAPPSFVTAPAARVAQAEGYFSASLVLLSLLAWSDVAL